MSVLQKESVVAYNSVFNISGFLTNLCNTPI